MSAVLKHYYDFSCSISVCKPLPECPTMLKLTMLKAVCLQFFWKQNDKTKATFLSFIPFSINTSPLVGLNKKSYLPYRPSPASSSGVTMSPYSFPESLADFCFTAISLGSPPSPPDNDSFVDLLFTPPANYYCFMVMRLSITQLNFK